MGCFDNAEVCDTTGLFPLHQLSHVVKKSDIVVYIDDGLGKLFKICQNQKLNESKKR